MDVIWAPWRMEYIGSAKEKTGKCFLCPDGRDESLVVAEGKKAFVVMNKFPYSNGHVMIVPRRHVGRIEEVADDELLEMMQLLKRMSTVMAEVLHVEGLNVGINMGKAAGAGLEEHIHIHVVPRWVGDTNFMPVVGETKVVSEHLQETFRKLKEKYAEKFL